MVALVLVPLFLAAGQWQWNKARVKADLQRELELRTAEPAVDIPTALLVDAPSLRYRKIAARGRYEPERQILIDNRMHQERAGYHVVTPLRLAGSDIRLLVNRGWIPAPADRRQVPQVDTPTGDVSVIGTAAIPATRFFVLGADGTEGNAAWRTVWQNLDIDRYGKAVDFPIQPIVLELDADSGAGGFVREWRRPDERRQTNLSYALQWWGFAATTVVLWLVFNVPWKRSEPPTDEGKTDR